MATGYPGAGSRALKEGEERAAELTTAEVLRLLGSGASGAILMALGDGPLRTKELTERVPGYAARTIYRYASKLTRFEIVERHEEPGVPSKVFHSLSEPRGRELRDLVDAYANASLARLPNGEIGSREWGSLALLADLWESGILEELDRGPRSATELAMGEHGLSFHQVNRRASMFAIGGFIEEIVEGARWRRYRLTERSRRAMALIAGVGRWRRRHIVPQGRSGLSAGEAAGLMRALLPLVTLPDHPGKSFELAIVSVDGEEETVWGRVGAHGEVVGCLGRPAEIDAAARGSVVAWVDSVLDGPQEQISESGGAPLLAEFLQRLHLVLWEEREPQAADSTAAVPAR